MTIAITEHGYERLKERTRFVPSKAIAIAEKAYYLGKAPNEFPKNTRKYLEHILQRSKDEGRGDTIRVLGNDSYIFANGVLITIIPIPERVRKGDCKNKSNLKRRCNDDED